MPLTWVLHMIYVHRSSILLRSYTNPVHEEVEILDCDFLSCFFQFSPWPTLVYLDCDHLWSCTAQNYSVLRHKLFTTHSIVLKHFLTQKLLFRNWIFFEIELVDDSLVIYLIIDALSQVIKIIKIFFISFNLDKLIF